MFLTSPASLGDAVRSARTSAGWSQRELAEYAGMSRQHLVAVEQGKGNPTWDTVLRLTSVLGLTLELQLGKSHQATFPKRPLPRRRTYRTGSQEKVSEEKSPQTSVTPRSSTSEKKRNEPIPSDGNIDLAALLAAHRSERRSDK